MSILFDFQWFSQRMNMDKQWALSSLRVKKLYIIKSTKSRGVPGKLIYSTITPFTNHMADKEKHLIPLRFIPAFTVNRFSKCNTYHC